jgi:uncharacterized short protein YbdD (DUF466 family)
MSKSDQGWDLRQRRRNGALELRSNGEYVNTPEKGLVGIPFFDEYVEKAEPDFSTTHPSPTSRSSLTSIS